MSFWRILIVVVLIAAGVLGFFYIRDRRAAEKKAEYYRFAGAIAETSVAAELYRNHPDSFLIARDSILKGYALTLEDIAAFRARLDKDGLQWEKVWNLVDSINDSLVKIQLERLKTVKDTTSDSLTKKASK
ncbi:MAG: hypothetical protein AB1746_04850 [Candidatus Zixiibacteriota bacterium]